MARTKKEIKETKSKKVIAEKPTPSVTPQNQFWSVILFAIGILLLLSAIIQGSSGWYVMHKVVRGIFGASIFLVAGIFIYTSIQMALDKSQQTILTKAFHGAILTFVLSGVIQIIFVGEVEGVGFIGKLKGLYESGIELKGGGVCGAVVGWLLLAVFGELGAIIIVILLFFVSIMLLMNFNLMDFLGVFGKVGIKIKNIFSNFPRNIKKVFEKFYIREEYDDYDDEIEDTDFDNDDDYIENDDNIEDSNDYGRASPIAEIVDVISSKRKNKLSRKQFEGDEEIIDMISTGNKIKEKSTAETLPLFEESIDIDIGDGEVSSSNKNEKTKDTKKATEKVYTNNDIDDIINQAVAMKNDSENKIKTDQLSMFEEDNIDIEDTVMHNKPPKYQLPPMEFLKQGIKADTSVSSEELKNNADKLVDTLKSFGVQTRIVGISRGPSVTRYEVQPSVGVKISKITGLADDIALNLAAAGVRIEAPIPGKPAVGIEIPNQNKDLVTLREMLESEDFKNAKSKLSFAVGRDIAGNVVIGDIAKMPHVIIAGSTGSGKSVCTNSIIMSILYKAAPEEVRLILIDPKIVEFKVYDGIPHLLIPVVTDPRKAAGALNWAVQEMLKRYKLFADNNVRDLKSYNEMAAEKEDIDPLPQIVIAIDELADLMMAASNDVETSICRLAQMARAAGMHLIIATQRPTVDVITGLIKANIPSRIALAVMSQTDSRTILDTGGADKLLGQGDMLYFPSGIPKPIRIQGCFCPTKDIEKVVEYVKSQFNAEYSEDILDEIERNVPAMKGEKNNNSDNGSSSGGDSEIIERAIDVVVEMGQASTSSLQRKLKLGYARAARVMDELENMGIVGAYEGAKPRKVLLSQQDWAERKMRNANPTKQ